MSLYQNQNNTTPAVEENASAQAVIERGLELARNGYAVGWIADQLANEFNMDPDEAYAVAEDAGSRVMLGRK
jgi:hypothetical protein